MYGDNMNLIPSADRQYQAVTPTQYKFLQQWVAGSFESDLARLGRRPPQAIEEVALAARPQTLDRAALTFCLGGPFHPGCEMTWPMRHISLYYAPFRIRVRAAADPEPDYGDQLTPAVTLGDNGPLYAQGPGDITRWMAVPWQTDTASCRAGYEADYDPYLPTFWPARVPNHVLSEANYQKVMNKRLPRRDRQLAFESRATFYRGLPGGHLDQIREMVTSFGTLGVVERREGPPNDPLFPPVIYVESQIGFDPDIPPDRNTVVGAVDKLKRRRRTQ
jgi:hypothetical protein